MKHESDLPREEREHLERMMLRNEEIRWTGRPVPRVRDWGVVYLTIVGVVACGVCGAVVYSSLFCEPQSTGIAVFMIPFCLLALYLLTSVLRYKLRLRRTSYALTNVRAIVLERGLFGGMEEKAYYLTWGMVQNSKRYGDGSGDIVFDRKPWHEMGRIFIGEEKPVFYHESGFIGLPDVAQVDRLLNRLISELDA